MVGYIEPSRNSGSVNGTMPTAAVGSGDNGDIKVPYRLPILEATCDSTCTGDCHKMVAIEAMIDAVDSSQAAQVGYHCDYGNKRQPIGVYEARKWEKGQRALAEKLKGESTTYSARRHAQRIMSDCFARGILRTPNETAKLNDAAGHPEPTTPEVTASAFFYFPRRSFSFTR